MTRWSIRELSAPASLDADDAWLLHGMVDAQNASTLALWGSDDFATTPRRALSQLADQEYVRRARLVAVDESTDAPDPARVLGFARLDLPLADNTHTGWLDLGVRPEHRGRGVGDALHATACDVARSAGRTHLLTETDQAAEPAPGPDTFGAPTGEGLVSRADRDVRFALARGWQLEQVARHSRLTLPVDAAALEEHRARAAAAAGPDYRPVTWDDATPDERVEQMCALHVAMSTDEPTAGLDVEEEVWDAARVRHADAQTLGRGEHLLTTAIEHVPTGRLVAYSAFMIPPHTDEFVWQEDTLVAGDHRGHRLGMLVKAVQLQALVERRPSVRRISTWNAEENRWMLAINVALGFRPAGGSGVWQRTL
ncbi:GCN5-related N-acetyltransferase [Cellulomonas flavigena DSM 20109]|uniref:GCN5-related N-acetyltransferase n=1 Tax=Cellulomonas flavigena (strain ATCC 482 / DSM 20109 / BCRC 11376 / JCM 18109 / NBRC 3775 / NCIMB 8073 / NRS 134) TaxID=446466 RepID=D5UGF8_CELFN|nr:GNAT family N-acetyltransferase [Cellulomonas flavigena]ADG73141.1 GCN5-related N-acetyltransferase [Cellulomonas flavigena DSM 20109]